MAKKPTKNERLIMAIRAMVNARSELTHQQVWVNDNATCNEDRRALFNAHIKLHMASVALEALLPGYHSNPTWEDLLADEQWARKSIQALDSGVEHLPCRY